MRKPNIAISMAVDPAANIWANGLNQNLAFLVELLRHSDAIGKVWLVHPGSEPATMPPGLAFDSLDIPLVRAADITHDVDVVIEFGTSLHPEWLRHVRALGARVAIFFVGHTYLGLAESAVFDRQGGFVFTGSPWDEVWTLPQFMKSSAPLLRTVARVPVHSMPHLWSPHFLQAPIQAAEQAGLSFGFRPVAPGQPRRPWRLAILEPNISVGKNSFISMLACDEAYRRERDCVELMMALNTFHMKEHRTFHSLAASLDLTRDAKAWYEPRLPFVQCMTDHRIDAVVAHHWEWGLNYSYYDALYGGYPLVHNSEFLQQAGMGFHYPGFSAQLGAQALLDAWKQEPGFWQDYRARARAYLGELAPDHPKNVEAFTRRILDMRKAPAHA